MIPVRSEPKRLASTPAQPMFRADGAAVEWCLATSLIDYPEAVDTMERLAEAIARGDAAERIWLVEHPPLYTAGTSSGDIDAARSRLPMHKTGRGGQVTYHGPGQRVAYVMLDLAKRRQDVRAFVAALERWIIDTLAAFALRGERREDRVGVWVSRRDKPPGLDGARAEDKIAAIGIRVRRWVTFHGISLNVEPDLTHYASIAPCGIAEAHLGVTSLADLGHLVTMEEVDTVLRAAFAPIFGPTVDACPILKSV